MNAARAEQIMEALAKLYPEARPELNFSNPFETLIATILSAQCTDKRVNLVTAKLFPAYPDAFAMAKLTPEQLEPHDPRMRALPQQGEKHRRRVARAGGAIRRRACPIRAKR